MKTVDSKSLARVDDVCEHDGLLVGGSLKTWPDDSLGSLDSSLGRSVTEEQRKPLSVNISRLNGQIPVALKPLIIFVGVNALGNAFPTSSATL